LLVLFEAALGTSSQTSPACDLIKIKLHRDFAGEHRFWTASAAVRSPDESRAAATSVAPKRSMAARSRLQITPQQNAGEDHEYSHYRYGNHDRIDRHG